MLLSEELVKYTVTHETGEPIVTYFTEISPNNIIELGKIAISPNVLVDPEKNLLLLQLLMTPHVHISLLEAIVPFIENITSQLESEQLKASLQSWLLQAKSLLQHQSP